MSEVVAEVAETEEVKEFIPVDPRVRLETLENRVEKRARKIEHIQHVEIPKREVAEVRFSDAALANQEKAEKAMKELFDKEANLQRLIDRHEENIETLQAKVKKLKEKQFTLRNRSVRSREFFDQKSKNAKEMVDRIKNKISFFKDEVTRLNEINTRDSERISQTKAMIDADGQSE